MSSSIRTSTKSRLAVILFLAIVCLTKTIPLADAQITIFDHLGLKHLRNAREYLFKFAGATGENAVDFKTNLRNNVSIIIVRITHPRLLQLYSAEITATIQHQHAILL